MVMIIRMILLFSPVLPIIFLQSGNYHAAAIVFLLVCFNFYNLRGFLPWKRSGTTPLEPRDAGSSIDSMYETCLNRDRTQSFEEWVGIAIETMAVDEIDSGNTNQELVDELKKKWGTTWELMYPKARVKEELSKEESYWTALKKFDDKVAADLGEDQAPET